MGDVFAYLSMSVISRCLFVDRSLASTYWLLAKLSFDIFSILSYILTENKVNLRYLEYEVTIHMKPGEETRGNQI